MNNEFPGRFGTDDDEPLEQDQTQSEIDESDDAQFAEHQPQEGRWRRGESSGSNIRRPRSRYPRRRLTSSSRNRGQGQDESRDLPLRQRMKIYRNRRPSR